MKRGIALLLALALTLSLSACGGEGGAPAETPSEAGGVPVDGSVAGEYTYEEILPFGTVPWTLTLAEDSTYTLSTTKPTGAEFVYTGTYEVKDGVVITGTPAEDASDIEAGFFNPDFSCAWVISGDGTMKPQADAGFSGPAEGTNFGNLSLQGDVLPEEAIGNTYVYEEVNEEFGFTTA